MLLVLHSPILSTSDLSDVMFVPKQEQQIVFAVDQTDRVIVYSGFTVSDIRTNDCGFSGIWC